MAGALALGQSGFDSSEGPHAWELATRLVADARLGSEEVPRGPAARGIDGRYYMSHDVGQTVVLVPVAALAEHLQPTFAAGHGLSRAQIAGLITSGAALVFVVLGCLGVYVAATLLNVGSERVAIWVALLTGTATILTPYSRMAFDGVLAGTFLVWAFVAALRVGADENARWLVALGVLAGLALITRQSMVVMLPGLLGLAYFRTERRATFALAPLAVTPFAAWQLYHNWVRTGDPLRPAVMLQQYDVTNAIAPSGVLEGVTGLLLSPGKSVFVYSPPLLLAVCGWWLLRRSRRDAALAVLSMTIPFVVLHGSVRNWAGDWGWGPRYMTSVTPILMVGLAPIVVRAVDDGDRIWRRALVIVAAMGIIFQTLALSGNWHFRNAYRVQTGTLDLHEMTWRLQSAQWLDTFGAVIENLHRPWSGAPVPTVDGVHPYVQAGASSANVWWVMLWSSNAFKPLIVMGVLGCVAVCVSGAWGLTRILRERTA